jgi:xylan 1,4-beta-xylosidase
MTSARADWEQRIGLRSEGAHTALALDPPTELRADAGAGLVALSWSPVEGAAGYVVYRDTGEGFAPLDHGGSDVLAVPAPPYADVEVEPGVLYRYAVAATVDASLEPGWPSDPVEARPLPGPPAPILVAVDASRSDGTLDRIWRMVGSERLSQLLAGKDEFGNAVGAEFHAALAKGRAELGVERVRAHAILHDDLGVFRWSEGGPSWSFAAIDRVYDQLVELGLRPVVELSFMPRDLASDPEATVFDYRAIISPPRDWSVWAETCGRLAEHLVARHGIEEVASWGFEVWNEPNLKVFWSGTQSEYFRLYDEAARAIKNVDHRLLVGGPATAAAEWIEDFAAFAADTGAPLDFVSTHTYGNDPLDLHASLRRHGIDGAEIWWTEWGVNATHFGAVHDTALGAPFVLHGLKRSQGRVDELAYWVISDHFEELGRPERLLHNGFGLLTVGNLRKPRYWAVRLASELGDELLTTRVLGDGAGSLVDAWAARDGEGRIDVLVWNGGHKAAGPHGDTSLGRTVELRIEALPAAAYRASIARVDEQHSNIARHVEEGVNWPTPEQWKELRLADKLDEEPLGLIEPARSIEADGGAAEIELELPMPGVIRVRLEPDTKPRTTEEGGKR